jgi:hypothetical protein
MKQEQNKTTDRSSLRPYFSPKLVAFGDWRTLTLGHGPNTQADLPNGTKAPLG